jgi:epoxyqueuosine reductase
MDHWVFGCDICQMVCPWNGSYKKESHIKIKKRINPLVDITSQLHFSEKEFQDFYAGTPVIRTGLNGFIRNLIVVAGNLVDSRVEKDLTRFLLNASDPMIRSHSGWALGKYHTANAREVLCRSLTSESDQTVLDEIHLALG